AKRADRGAFCPASVARGIGGVGVRTQRYPLRIFRIAIPDRLCALCRGTLDRPVRVDRHYARTGVIGQTDASDLAFRNAAARLLAVAPAARPDGEGTSVGRSPQGSGYRDCVAGVGETTVGSSSGGV